MFFGILLNACISIDKYGNIAVQTSISHPFDNKYDTQYIGTFDVGCSIFGQITDAETVYDLEGNGESVGGSAALGGLFGLDGINLDEDNELEGGSIQIGGGFGIDNHIINSYTDTLFSFNIIEKWNSIKKALGFENKCDN